MAFGGGAKQDQGRKAEEQEPARHQEVGGPVLESRRGADAEEGGIPNQDDQGQEQAGEPAQITDSPAETG